MKAYSTLLNLKPRLRLETAGRRRQPNGWDQALQSEGAADGLIVTLIDFTSATGEIHDITGPPALSISFFLRGRGLFALQGGAPLEISPDTTFLFHSVAPTRGRNEFKAQSRLLAVDFRFTPELLWNIGFGSLDGLPRAFDEDASVGDAIFMRRRLHFPLRRIAEECFACRMGGAARATYLRSRAFEALAHIAALGDGMTLLNTDLSNRDQRLIRRAANVLTERFSESWTISGLAREVGINERKLKQGFRQCLGQTVHNYLEEIRITSARKLLARHEYTVMEVALATGYNNASHFAKIFKRRVGVSPRYWRSMN